MIDIVRADGPNRQLTKKIKLPEEKPLEPLPPNKPKPEFNPPTEETVENNPSDNIPSKTSRRRRFHPIQSWKKMTKKQRLSALGITGLFLIIGTQLILTAIRKDPPPPPPIVISPKKEEPKPTTEASRLTGVQIKPELNKLPITGVMIENSPDARPQSGLKDAGIVFEAIAEGGITRFLALYLESKPDYIGPVRSARPYYLDLVSAFDGALAHAGGSADALVLIRRYGIKDLDQFGNPAAYSRVSSRFAPHNLYTSRDKLLQLQKAKGFTKSNFKSLPRKKEETPRKKPNARTINLTLSGFLYNPTFTYDAKTNSYKRSMAGKPHTDERSRSQLSPKVVIAIITTHHYQGIHSVYRVAGGKGKVFVFQDGGVINGTWRKNTRTSQFVFENTEGKTIELNPGQTWITLVEAGGVKHSP